MQNLTTKIMEWSMQPLVVGDKACPRNPMNTGKRERQFPGLCNHPPRCRLLVGYREHDASYKPLIGAWGGRNGRLDLTSGEVLRSGGEDRERTVGQREVEEH
jgi:hypothetical protein